MSERIAMLGAGSWGLAVTSLLERNGHRVTMWEFDAKEAARLKKVRTIPEKLPDFVLAESVEVTNDLGEALDGCTLVVLAVPAQTVRSVLRLAAMKLTGSVGIVNLAKGIEARTIARVSEIVTEEIGGPLERFAVLSGPSHAEEVIRNMPTTVVAAGIDDRFTERIQTIFASPGFRVYRSDDLVGVELGGSLKNIIAIAAGIASGLEFGDNTMGALLTRGLAEITRLGLTLGAQRETFAGLSGLGDLVTTCISRHSRNRQVGLGIAKGGTLDQVLAGMTMVAEGVETTRSGYTLAGKYDVEMPITTEVYRVLFEDKPAIEALGDLMGRTLKAEVWS